jgi:hypothetical protein
LISILARKYSRLIVMIDEMEKLGKTSTTERQLFSDYLRRVHDDVEAGVTWILIFTFDTYAEVQETLQVALRSRVKRTIEFGYVKSSKDVKEYISECWEQRSGHKITKVFDSDVISMVSQKLFNDFKGTLSFRVINLEMHNIMVRCYLAAGSPQKIRVSASLYQKSASLTPKDVLRELRNER